MKKKMAFLLLVVFILPILSTSVMAANPGDIVITKPGSMADAEIETVVSNLAPNSMISFQAFYKAPGAGGEFVLDHINQYTLDNTGGLAFSYPTGMTMKNGGVIRIIIGGGGLTEPEVREYSSGITNITIKAL
jgi:hypothetical protein